MQCWLDMQGHTGKKGRGCSKHNTFPQAGPKRDKSHPHSPQNKITGTADTLLSAPLPLPAVLFCASYGLRLFCQAKGPEAFSLPILPLMYSGMTLNKAAAEQRQTSVCRCCYLYLYRRNRPPCIQSHRQATGNRTPAEIFKHSLHQINSSCVTLFAHRFGPDTALNLPDVGLSKQVHT